MFDRSVNSKTILTSSILVIAIASLFASGPILGTQQALAAPAGGGGFGGGRSSFVSGTGGLGGSGGHAGFVSGSHAGFVGHTGFVGGIGHSGFVGHIGFVERPAFVSFSSNSYGMKYKGITRHMCPTTCYDVPQKI